MTLYVKSLIGNKLIESKLSDCLFLNQLILHIKNTSYISIQI